jgi:hypothetical protein
MIFFLFFIWFLLIQQWAYMIYTSSVTCALGTRVTTSSTDFSFQKNLVSGIYLHFQRQKSLKNLPHSESKSYQINSIKSCSSRSFQQHQRHIPIPLKFFSYDLI